MAIGGSTNGNLETNTDRDWFRLNLLAGTSYTFRQNAIDSGLDSYLYLRNSSGSLLASDDDNGGNNNSLFSYTPQSSGTYYLDAASYNSASRGRYTVSATAANTDTTAPIVSSMSVNGSTLVLTLNEALRSTIPSTARFAVLVNNSSRSVSAASINTANNTVSLTLTSPVMAGDSVTLAYTDPTGNDTSGVVEDAAGNDLATFSPRAVSNATPPNGTGWWSEGRFRDLWGFSQSTDRDIDAPEAFASWGSPSGGISNLNSPQNKVAVLDTGIRRTHEDLSQNYIGGYDFISNDNDPSDGQGHGTHVSGTIAAVANTAGVVGANPVAKLLAVKVLSDSGSGSTAALIEGINYAVQEGARVLSMSLGYSPGANPGTALRDALSRAGSAECLSVIAAGNNTNNNDLIPTYPGSYPDASIITVAASNSSDSRASFSNYGLTSVDLYAPGQDILSTHHTSDSAYTYMSGTSMATPLVAGIVSAYWARNPSLSASQVKARLMQSVDPLAFTRDTVTGGRVNMAKMFGLSPSSTDQANMPIDPVTGNQQQIGSIYRQSIDNSQSSSSAPAMVNNYNLSNIDALSSSSLASTDNIIVFMSGDARERRSDSVALDAAIAQGGVKYQAFGEFESMGALGDTIGILSIEENARSRQTITGLKDMLSRGLISGFEIDTPVTMI